MALSEKTVYMTVKVKITPSMWRRWRIALYVNGESGTVALGSLISRYVAKSEKPRRKRQAVVKSS